METKIRTAARTATFRILATIITMLLVYAFTGDLAIAGTLGLLEFVAKLMLYYIHERTWDHVHWGMKI